MHSATRLAEARQALGAGELESALGLYSQVVSDQGGSDHLLEAAEVFWRCYRFDESIEALTKAIDQNPSICLIAAKRLFSIGRFASSEKFLRQALAKQPSDANLLRMLAEIVERQGRIPEAIEISREACRQDPSDARCARALAHALRNQGHPDQSVATLTEHLEQYQTADDWRLLQELGNCYDALGKYREAMNALLLSRRKIGPIAEPLLKEWNQRAERRRNFAFEVTKERLQNWKSKFDLPVNNIAVLAGHPRSGTTLLENLLGRHSSVVTTDETGILRKEFVEPIILQAESCQDAVCEVDNYDSEQLKEGRDFYFRATVAHLGEEIGDRLLIEKDPLATQDLGMILRLLPEATIIYPLRDPRDVVISYFFTLVPLNADSAPALSLQAACRAAALSLELWKYWKEVIPQRWVEVRYENLVQEPTREMNKLWSALDLPVEDALPNADRKTQDKGVRTPTYAAVAKPIHNRSAGRWKNYEEWLQPHLPILQPWLKEFSYE